MPQQETAGSARPIPPGMLRVSKKGEEDRVVFPVHAQGWARHGWSVHFPPEDEDPGGGGEPPLTPMPPPPEYNPPLTPLPPPGDDDLGNLPAPVGDGDQAEGEAEGEGEGGVPDLGTDPPGGFPVAEVPPVEPPDFESMTRAQIVEAAAEVYGVDLNPNQSRPQLLEQALALAAAPAAAEELAGASGGSADGIGVAVPDLGL